MKDKTMSLIEQCTNIITNRKWVCEYIAEDCKGVLQICWRYNEFNPKNYQTAESFVEMYLC